MCSNTSSVANMCSNTSSLSFPVPFLGRSMSPSLSYSTISSPRPLQSRLVNLGTSISSSPLSSPTSTGIDLDLLIPENSNSEGPKLRVVHSLPNPGGVENINLASLVPPSPSSSSWWVKVCTSLQIRLDIIIYAVICRTIPASSKLRPKHFLPDNCCSPSTLPSSTLTRTFPVFTTGLTRDKGAVARL